MSNLVRHPFHLVDESPWPLLSALGGLGLTSGLGQWFHYFHINLFIARLILLILVSYQWWADITQEATLQGLHSKRVEAGMRYGIILFIASEVIFFLSFFWAFFHSRLCPNVELAAQWPPWGVSPFNANGVPLLNTLILLRSGVTVTWAHHCLIAGGHQERLRALTITVGLGLWFTALQGLEYSQASFSFAEGIFGSTFFIATGFHGLHVIIGTIFLFLRAIRVRLGHIRPIHHFGLEAAAWYWHFVDVIWLFLFTSVYWWGGNLI